MSADRRGRELYRRVAQLHLENIHLGFLSSLGLPFLTLLYQAIDEEPSSVLIVAERDGAIVGFVAGAVGMRPIYRRMLKRWPRLFLALWLPALKPASAWRMLETLRHVLTGGARSEGHADLPDAELLSIAVDPAHRGRQVAQSLFQQLREHFLAKGIARFRIVVGAELGPAHRFYRNLGAVPVSEIEVHRGARSTVYVCSSD